jgi:hypothetical protein
VRQIVGILRHTALEPAQVDQLADVLARVDWTATAAIDSCRAEEDDFDAAAVDREDERVGP